MWSIWSAEHQLKSSEKLIILTPSIHESTVSILNWSQLHHTYTITYIAYTYCHIVIYIKIFDFLQLQHWRVLQVRKAQLLVDARVEIVWISWSFDTWNAYVLEFFDGVLKLRDILRLSKYHEKMFHICMYYVYIYIIIINKYYIRYAHYFGSFTNCYGYLEGLMSAKCSLRKSRRCFGRESPGHVRHLGTLRLAGHGFSNNELGTWKQERGFKDLFLRVVLL
jgi:hypothetical protein